MTFLVILLVLIIAIGTLLFMLGYGALFVAAFTQKKTVSVILLVLVGFSSVAFVFAGKPWYYALPFWFIPPLYAQFTLADSKIKRRAVQLFWAGVFLLAASLSFLFYMAYQNSDIAATLEQFKQPQTQLKNSIPPMPKGENQ